MRRRLERKDRLAVDRPVAHPTWVDHSGYVIRPVLEDLADPSTPAGVRSALQQSLARTRAVLGEAVTMADAKTVKTVTGSSIGGVPPVGHPEPIRTIMDETLLALPVVWAAAASQNSVFDIEPQRLADATNATIARVS